MQEILNKFEGTKVLVIGDIMIDRYLTGGVKRISPEAPVPILKLEGEENRLGGAANVALNLIALGAKVHLLTIIGDDNFGAVAKKLLICEENIIPIPVVIPNRLTTVKTRLLSENQQLLRVDKEHTHFLERENEDIIIKEIEKVLQNERIDIVLFQDYNKGLLTKRIIENTIQIAKQKNIPITVDPKKKNFLTYKGVNLFKPNLKEVRGGLGIEVLPNLESLNKASRLLRSQLSHSITYITLSEHGIYFDDGKTSEIVPTFAKDIVDVCGAGDTVIAVVTLCLANDVDLKTMAKLSNLAGGQVCAKPGVVVVNYEFLQRSKIY